MEHLIKPETLAAIRQHGLHKVAGAMHGYDELTIKEGVQLLGEQMFLKRAEHAQIIRGIASYAHLHGEKIAESPWGKLLMRAAGPAALGGMAAYLASPINAADPNQNAKDTAMGVGIGGAAGLLNALRKGFNNLDPAALQTLTHALP